MIKTIYDIPEHIFKTSYQNATIGHVLTPPKLALEMIETLPSDFIKSGIRVLDPACKNGSFLFQLVIKQLDKGWTIKDIEKSLYTCDTLMASLNVAESGVKHIIRFPYQNSLIKINNLLYKHIEMELLYDNLIKTISKNKYISIRQFINELLLDRKNNWLIVKFEENLIHLIKKYEGLSKTESKLFGEVFTPQALIEEMLDTLPSDVWSNPNLKWLDPAVGIGNFPAAILNRLMEGLKDIIIDSDERRKHILEEMLYMGDISTKNLFLLYQLFDLNNEFKLNVFRGDFLSEKFDKHMKEVWGLDSFDLVVGNPPFQENDDNGKRKPGGSNLYTKFIKKSLDITKYLLFITPQGWMAPGNENSVNKFFFRDYMISNTILYLESGVSQEYFNVGSKFTSFLIKVGKEKDKETILKTKINNEVVLSKINLNNIENLFFLPTLLNKLCFDIYNKVIFSTNKKMSFVLDLEYDIRRNDDIRIKSDKYPYKVYNTGTQIRYSKFKTKNYDKKKVIISGSGNLNPIFEDGDAATANNTLYMIVKDNEEGKKIVNLLESMLYKFILYHSKYSGFFTKEIIWSLPLPYENLTSNFSNEELYEYFNLTSEEIKLIEETISEPTKKKKSKKK